MKFSEQTNTRSLLAGILATLIAFVCHGVTLVDGDYRATLLAGLLLTIFAGYQFAVMVYRGPLLWRIAGVVLTIPLLLFLYDFFRRAPHAF